MPLDNSPESHATSAANAFATRIAAASRSSGRAEAILRDVSQALEFRSNDVSDPARVEAAVRFDRDSFVCGFGDDERFDERQYVA